MFTDNRIQVNKNAYFGSLRGAAAVHRPTKRGFRVVLFDEHLGAGQLRRSAQLFNWKVSWIGATGKHTGVTPTGYSGWKQDLVAGTKTVYLDVNTLGSGLPLGSKPIYFPSLISKNNGWRAQGVDAVYPTFIGGLASGLVAQTAGFRM